MVFKLHTASYSDTGCLLIIVTKELGLYDTDQVEIVESSFFGITSPEWTEHQPLQRMPWMEDTEAGVELFESRTIAKYMATKVKSPLVIMGDSTAAFKFDQMCMLETNHFFSAMAWLVGEVMYAESFYQRPKNTNLIEVMEKELNTRVLPGYERILSKQKYLCGDDLTLVDLFHVFLGKPVNDAGHVQVLSDGSLPNVKKWFTSLTSRQSVREAFEIKSKAYMAFTEAMKKGQGA